MLPRSQPGPGQGELVVIAAQSGQMYAPDFTDLLSEEEPNAVALIERNIHLQNTITYLAAVSMRDGFIKNDNAAIRSGEPAASPAMRQGVIANRGKFATLATETFIRATGNELLAAAGLISERELKAMNRQMSSDFRKKYYGERHYAESQEYRRQLIHNNLALSLEGQTKFNHAHRLRPHRPYRIPQTTVERHDFPRLEEAMDTFKRLRAIVTDPRAGFIPTTNREKNQVLTFLDYIDNPNYPFGVNNQYLEVFSRSQVIKRKNKEVDSQRGPVSITYELGDYLRNATEQAQALQTLEELLTELPNLRVTLGEEGEWIDISHPGFAALIRYHDLSEFMEKERLPAIKDPLRTREYRWTRKGPGQRKRVEDYYTAEHKPEDFENYLAQSIASTTVGAARKLIGAAIDDQLRREAFMRQRLQEIATPPDYMRGKAREVLEEASKAALQIISELQAA